MERVKLTDVRANKRAAWLEEARMVLGMSSADMFGFPMLNAQQLRMAISSLIDRYSF
jgi:hypothetical protein